MAKFLGPKLDRDGNILQNRASGDDKMDLQDFIASSIRALRDAFCENYSILTSDHVSVSIVGKNIAFFDCSAAAVMHALRNNGNCDLIQEEILRRSECEY